MIKEIKHNRLLGEFKKNFIDNSYINEFKVSTKCNHKKTDYNLYMINRESFIIQIERIVSLFHTEIDSKIIVHYLNSEFNKDNRHLILYDKDFQKIN